MRTNTRRAGAVKIALIEPKKDDAVWLEWLLYMAGVSTDVARVDWARPEIGDAQLILLGLERLDEQERKILSRLHALYPRVPLVILAGASAAARAGDAVRLGALHMLRKSALTPAALTSTIRHCAHKEVKSRA